MHSSHQHHHCNKLSVSLAILITFQTFLSVSISANLEVSAIVHFFVFWGKL